jgi:hypothetical protein
MRSSFNFALVVELPRLGLLSTTGKGRKGVIKSQLNLATNEEAARQRGRGRMKQLQEIRFALMSWRLGRLPPRRARATRSGALAFCGVFLLAHVFLPIAGIQQGLLAAFLEAGAAGILVSALVDRHGRAPSTHADQMDALLADYEPESAEAYRWLQSVVEEQGGFTVDAVDMWVERETDALQHTVAAPREGRFVNKTF